MTRAEELRRAINKAMGGEVLKTGSDGSYKVGYMSTGLLPFDILFNGGIPRGRFVTVTGAYSTLKSYLGLHALAAAQRRGETVALIDTEHAFDPDWATQLGVDLKNLIVWPPLDNDQPVTGEEAFDVANVLVGSKVDLVVFDSVAASLPQQEQDKRLSKESVQPGRLAALMSLAMRKLTAPNEKTGILFINQLREQIGVTFGNPEKATGGRALPYYSSFILNVRAAGFLTESVKLFDGHEYKTTTRKVGQKFVAQLQKSKLSAPWQDVHFDFNMVNGEIDLPRFLFAQGVVMGEILKRGNTWESTSLGLKAVGKDQFREKLAADDGAMQALDEMIRAHHGLPSPGRRSAPGRTKAAGSRRSSSSSKVSGRIPAQAVGGSSTTAATRKRLSR